MLSVLPVKNVRRANCVKETLHIGVTLIQSGKPLFAKIINDFFEYYSEIKFSVKPILAVGSFER